MLGALEYILVPLTGLLAWHETRVYGERVDDRDYVEAASVIAGVIVLIGYTLGGELVQPVEVHGLTAEQPGVWEVRRWTLARATVWGAAVTGSLIALEAALDDEDIIDHEWRLFRRDEVDE